MSIRVLDPTQAPEVMPVTLAERKSHDEVCLGLLSNGKSNAAKILQMVAKELSAHLPVAGLIERQKDSASTNADEATIHQLAESADLALVAIGD